MICSNTSKFIFTLLLVTGLVFGTRWMILHFYNGSYASSDPRGTEGRMRLVGAPSPPAEEPAAAPVITPVPLKLEMPAKLSSQ